ncbi:MAG: hypothetical protein Q8P51_09280 [Ignavibacteria bacterium]|nr:hypothetical protein [Ignavibacteria bacterium]
MITTLHKPVSLVLLMLLPVGVAASQEIFQRSGRGQEVVAVLPFDLRGISVEDGVHLAEKFEQVLAAETSRFSILHPDTMKAIFVEAGIKNLEGCDYTYCLADMGKILGVQKVVHVSASRRGKLYVLNVRLVNVADASLLYAERVDFSGDLSVLTSEVIPEQARKLGGARLDSGARWYYVAAAILLGVGVIYWIYRSFDKSLGEGDSGSTIPPTQQ